LGDYFAAVVSTTTNILYLTTPMLSSILLYIAGIVFNDYFDIEIDLKERPFRLYLSGKISKQSIIIAILSLAVSNIFGPQGLCLLQQSFMVSFIIEAE
jgi:4-hydroxybenzoate polyprenyltransferase